MRDILKAGFKVGVATLASLLGWLVAGKLLAISLGAAGVGLFGLLRQLLQNLTLVGSVNGQNALVQGIASRGDRKDQISYSGSVLRIQALAAGLLAMVLVIGSRWLGPWLIPHPQATHLIQWLALAMIITVSQAYVIGLLNGHRLINQLVKSQMLGPIAVLALLYPMIWLVRGGHSSAFILMLGGPGLLITIAATISARRLGWLPKLLEWRISRADATGFFRMSGVLMFAGIVATGTQFFQSWLVAKKLGLAQAGQFWTAWTLSMTYVTVVLGSFGTYYMPSLSRLKEPEARRGLIRDYLRLSILAMPLLVSMVVVIKPLVIRGLFSTALLPALTVMRWMLIGDLFKGFSWVLAFPMLAFGEMKWFFWTEVSYYIGMAGTAWVWLSLGGAIAGLGLLFMVLNILYFIVMVIYIRIEHGFGFELEDIVKAFGGLLMVLLLSGMTWRDDRIHYLPVSSFVVLGLVFAGTTLGRNKLMYIWHQMFQ